jgi:hypothetical protein
MTTVVISQPMLFPWVGMLEQIKLADIYVHYDDVQFSKQSFTNRVQVKSAQGSSWLTIPLRSRPHDGLIRDLAANDDGDWRSRHRRLLLETYKQAPHRDEMLSLVEGVYASASPTLCGLIESSMEVLAHRVGALGGTRVEHSSEMGVSGTSWKRVLEIVQVLEGDVYVTGHGGWSYLDHEAFEAAGIEVRYMDYALSPYPQLHGEFTPYVSALDLIANTGPEAPLYVQPRTVSWRDFRPAGH